MGQVCESPRRGQMGQAAPLHNPRAVRSGGDSSPPEEEHLPSFRRLLWCDAAWGLRGIDEGLTLHGSCQRKRISSLLH